MAIQNYTLADYRAELQLRLNDPMGGGLWSVSELNGYINVAILRIAMDTRIFKKDAPLPIMAGAAVIYLPADNLAPEWIYASSIWGMDRIFPTSWLSLDKMGQGFVKWEVTAPNRTRNFVPYSWDQIAMYPPPSVTGTINLHYTPYPSTLVLDTDTFPYPLNAQKLVSIFAAYLAQLKNDMQKATGHLTEYRNRVNIVLEQNRHNQQMRPTSLTPGGSFDRRNANPEVGRFTGLRGYF